ncbi:MAG: phosphate butyryltransferase [Prevotella sp.]|jgi:phosphate butyryltransferase|uniref:phosphate acyltransferase n=1 Tax=Prevotella sp. tf2-5 TaxID=1761889 RepID=UPI0008F3394B|nr:phosphate acyltransferase [Prevotella sp. tf2-5]MBR2244686.1 phosphate butyryltransferase [Prevotella sp.]MCR5712751.1 phosphate butyryltransferase [Prevotella sp.]SFO53488.1 phosphate butyryltransferase [Prevotella sp. tf2-5]
MQPIKTLNDMIIFLRERGDRKRVAVVSASDASTRYAVEKGKEMGFIEPIYIDGDDKEACARQAVALCRNGEADILMKGLINTDVLLRAILDKEKGIIRPGHVLTHVAMAEIPKYEKLLFFTDAAVIPVPTPAQRRQQIHYMNYVCHAMGIEEPRISLIHCAEKVSAKAFPYTTDYLEIIAEAQTGCFGHCIIDGPLDLKTSLDAVSLHEKGIHSIIDGQADALIFPDIVAGNVFYKTLTLFAYAKTAGVLQGTLCPCVVSSRADSPDSKYYSLALAAL